MSNSDIPRFDIEPGEGQLFIDSKPDGEWVRWADAASRISSSIEPASGDGAREALRKIAGGHDHRLSDLVLAGQWQSVVNVLQEIARNALASSPAYHEEEPVGFLTEANASDLLAGRTATVMPMDREPQYISHVGTTVRLFAKLPKSNGAGE